MSPPHNGCYQGYLGSELQGTCEDILLLYSISQEVKCMDRITRIMACDLREMRQRGCKDDP